MKGDLIDDYYTRPQVAAPDPHDALLRDCLVIVTGYITLAEMLSTVLNEQEKKVHDQTMPVARNLAERIRARLREE